MIAEPRAKGYLGLARPKRFVFPDVGRFIEEYKGPEMARSILALNGLPASRRPEGVDSVRRRRPAD